MGAKRKIEFLAARHGQGYWFTRSPHHYPESGTASHYMYTDSGEWAGEITHNEDGHIGHMYLQPGHTAALPVLLKYATDYSERNGWLPPHKGKLMSPKALRMAQRILPDTTKKTGGYTDGVAMPGYEDH